MSEFISDRKVVEYARGLIATKETWTQRAGGRDAEGEMIPLPPYEGAVRFCAQGAITRGAYILVGHPHYIRVSHRIIHGIGASKLLQTNDDVGYKAVLQLLDDWLAQNPA